MLKTTNSIFTWTHVSEPTQHEINTLDKKYNFHELIMEDLLELSGENKVDYYPDDWIVSITLNFPKYKPRMKKYLLNSFVIIIWKDFLISFSRFHSKSLEALIKKMSSNNQYVQDFNVVNTFDAVYEIIDAMYEKTVVWLKKARKEVLDLQEKIIYSKKLQKDYIEKLMTKKVNMVILKHTFIPQKELLFELKKYVIKLLDLSTTEADSWDINLYIDDLDSKLDKIVNNISIMSETIGSLTDTYNALMNIQTNNIITILTIFTAATWIMAVIVWAYWMNVLLPFWDSPHAFTIILGFMASLFIWIVLWFRKRGWL